jgi:hypothetical protein
MKHRVGKCRKLVWLSGIVAAIFFALPSEAETKSNPYGPIIERNAFGLRPPPPPQADTPPPAPPVPLAKITLTGITSMFGPSSKRALLEVVEQEAGKAAGTPRKPILREGERDGSVEVLTIDVEKNIVRVRNGTVETNLTFEVVKSSPSAGVPGPAVAAVAPATPTLVAAAPPSPPPVFTPAPVAGPTIISRNSSSSATLGGSAVTVMGGGPVSSFNQPAAGSSPNTYAAASSYPAAPTYAGSSPAVSTISSPGVTALGANPETGGLQVPNRPVRTQPIQNSGGQEARVLERWATADEKLFPPIPPRPGAPR